MRQTRGFLIALDDYLSAYAGHLDIVDRVRAILADESTGSGEPASLES
jgi:hypothetical protein